jgi:hypothetical protein
LQILSVPGVPPNLSVPVIVEATGTNFSTGNVADAFTLMSVINPAGQFLLDVGAGSPNSSFNIEQTLSEPGQTGIALNVPYLVAFANEVSIVLSPGVGNSFPVPGPIAGAGLPGLILASGGLLGWWRRRRVSWHATGIVRAC